MHVDYALAQRTAMTDDFFFVQIGAFDGRTADPLYGFVKAYRCRGVLVEPQERFFRELEATYAGHDNLTLRRVAISDRRETRPLYTVADAPGVPHWAGLLASFDRDTLLSHREFLPGLDDLVRVEQVECITLSELLEDAGVEHIDLLQIDVEGYDSEIIRMLDFSRFAPSIVRFEHVHLSTRQHESSIQRLIDHGYRVCLEEHDTLAYRAPDGPVGGPARAVEGPARLQERHDAEMAAAHQAHVARVADLEESLEQARAWTERVVTESNEWRERDLQAQREHYTALLEATVKRAEAAERRLEELQSPADGAVDA